LTWPSSPSIAVKSCTIAVDWEVYDPTHASPIWTSVATHSATTHEYSNFFVPSMSLADSQAFKVKNVSDTAIMSNCAMGIVSGLNMVGHLDNATATYDAQEHDGLDSAESPTSSNWGVISGDFWLNRNHAENYPCGNESFPGSGVGGSSRNRAAKFTTNPAVVTDWLDTAYSSPPTPTWQASSYAHKNYIVTPQDWNWAHYGGAGLSLNKGVELESQLWLSEYTWSEATNHKSTTSKPYHGTGSIAMQVSFEPTASTWESDCDMTGSGDTTRFNCPTTFVRATWSDADTKNLVIDINGNKKSITKDYLMTYGSMSSNGTISGIKGGDQWYEMRLSVTPSGHCTED